MTIAVCYKCGKFKHGAFTSCFECSAVPQEEDDDFILSLALTDHFFDPPTLKTIGEGIEAGEKIHLDPETRKALLQKIPTSMLKRLKEKFKS